MAQHSTFLAAGSPDAEPGEFVFGRDRRLLSKAEFDRVFGKAERSVDGVFTVLYRRNDRVDARLGLAIAKKRIRHAVDRNRLKRLIRESFRHAKKHLIGVDIVIMARDRANSASNEQVFESLQRHWRRVAQPEK